MQMPPAMAFPKGNASFMPAQQQRMEVTVPVPEARVSLVLLHLFCLMSCKVPGMPGSAMSGHCVPKTCKPW